MLPANQNATRGKDEVQNDAFRNIKLQRHPEVTTKGVARAE